MTISDFLKLPNFTDLRLLAGKNGLSNDVTNVTVVDTPDGTNWLNGKELVITTAYMLHEEKDLLEFLRTLNSKKAAGIGIKENRYLTEIPETGRRIMPASDLCSGSISLCRYHQPGPDPDHQQTVFSSDPGKYDP
mgnify:CR=1 FL=1